MSPRSLLCTIIFVWLPKTRSNQLPIQSQTPPWPKGALGTKALRTCSAGFSFVCHHLPQILVFQFPFSCNPPTTLAVALDGRAHGVF